MSENPSTLYRDAIAALQAVSADFATDQATRNTANAQITELRGKLQDAALDQVASRTANLQALSGKLSGVLARAQGASGSKLKALAQRVRASLGA